MTNGQWMHKLYLLTRNKLCSIATRRPKDQNSIFQFNRINVAFDDIMRHCIVCEATIIH